MADIRCKERVFCSPSDRGVRCVTRELKAQI